MSLCSTAHSTSFEAAGYQVPCMVLCWGLSWFARGKKKNYCSFGAEAALSWEVGQTAERGNSVTPAAKPACDSESVGKWVASWAIGMWTGPWSTTASHSSTSTAGSGCQWSHGSLKRLVSCLYMQKFPLFSPKGWVLLTCPGEECNEIHRKQKLLNFSRSPILGFFFF